MPYGLASFSRRCDLYRLFDTNKLIITFSGKEYVVEFDFLGKDSIRYNNAVPVEKRVYKNVALFMENKKHGDDLFDRLNTSILNEYLNGKSILINCLCLVWLSFEFFQDWCQD